LHHRHKENLIFPEEFANEDAADCEGWQGVDEREEDRPVRCYSSLAYKEKSTSYHSMLHSEPVRKKYLEFIHVKVIIQEPDDESEENEGDSPACILRKANLAIYASGNE
jgi:hypothetical protein